MYKQSIALGRMADEVAALREQLGRIEAMLLPLAQPVDSGEAPVEETEKPTGEKK
jgi:hypothetical protein